jgi:D-mannonate dehydratase
MCQGLLTGCEKVMNEEEDRLLYSIISLVSSLMNFMVNFCKGCISSFLEEEIVSNQIEFTSILHTFFQHTYQLNNLEIDVVMDYNQECLLPFLINGLLQFGKVV